MSKPTDKEPNVVFAGSTASKRIATVELHDQDGETMIVTRVFQPIPDRFREDFSGDEGTMPGGSWKVLQDKEGNDAVLFKTQGYTLQYAALIAAGFAAALTRHGDPDVMDQVTVIDWDADAAAFVDRKLPEGFQIGAEPRKGPEPPTGEVPR